MNQGRLFIWLISLEIICEGLAPNSCERNACIPSASFCSEHLPGVYRHLGPACRDGSTCTDCSVSASGLVTCICEKVPFTPPAKYGESCGYNALCVDGSECFRPCDTFLFKAQCPMDRCVWSDQDRSCSDQPIHQVLVQWSTIISDGMSPHVAAQSLVSAITSFPISFPDLDKSVYGFRVNGLYLSRQVSVETLFSMLDSSLDGLISQSEFQTGLEPALAAIFPEQVSGVRRLSEKALVPALTGSDVNQCLTLTADSPAALMAACAAPEVQGEICRADGGKFFCALSSSCVDKCMHCDWLSAENIDSHRCEPATLDACKTLKKQYCPSLSICVDDCNWQCTTHPWNDSSGFTCRSEWDSDQPSSDPSKWICKYRKSADQSCVSDMDCVFGAKTCVSQKCAPISSGSPCKSHRDCGIGFHCPSDPTGGLDPYYSQTCKPQEKEGGDCMQDANCLGIFKCNEGKCRKMFSLYPGNATVVPELCQSGQVDISGKVCSIRYNSKRAAQTCASDMDCGTTDISGSVARCQCTGWWESDSVACKRCQAVTGDLSNDAESLRDYLYQRGTLCSSVWSDEECRREVPQVSTWWNIYMCELQTLGGGVSVLSSSSVCSDSEPLRKNYCN